MTQNIILGTDSYKVSHWRQYPPGTTRVFSYIEARGGEWPETVFFGLQAILAKHLVGRVVSCSDIDDAEHLFGLHFGDKALFNRPGWERIAYFHDGRLPLLIKAAPEGSVVPTGNALLTIENTDPELPWLTNYVETLLCQVWYPSTIATKSRAIAAVVRVFLEETGTPELLPFKVHDFGYRGSTSVESAGIGAAAHLLSFKGTDTFAGIETARDYYGEDMAGFSIPAAEHSTVTSWGRDCEIDAFANMLEQFPTGLVAVVSDSYDVTAACSYLWGQELRERVLSRDGTLVIRPDSGAPVETVLKVLGILYDCFPTSINEKGFKVLDPHVRLIQGDGIDINMIGYILNAMRDAGWSADNIAFGSGGGLLQSVTRDTQGFAFKCSAIERNGLWQDVYKAPVTDPRKRSKAGRLALVRDAAGWRTCLEAAAAAAGGNLLVPVFHNGYLCERQTFAAIRDRLDAAR